MITLTSAELNTWIAALLWPLTRILGLIAVAPVFGNTSVPVQVKIGIGVMLTLIVAPTLPALPTVDPMSFPGLLILVQQLIIGLGMGFAMRIIFAGVEMAGAITGMTMGLSFASFFDPQSQGQSNFISQFMSLLATLAFLAVNGHLLLLSVLAHSFSTFPISASPMGGQIFKQIADWGGIIFSAGVQLSLPMVAALLITNIALGILTRAAPQLNLFGIGFPITLTIGFVVIGLALPYLATPLERLFQQGIEMAGQITMPAVKVP
ncbi:flagellar biosynthesis protein FliR [Sulfuriferula multivorans]|uniref:Flagellar biosynthetic protein FliR n=1 Tax=Sulfuriferula multivorans TaxID=1559896 RepID=A0A401JD95_9PROT|nr:flagellar biosynthetic protein FliR [Sulfuriferula multivorans]GBL45645.1 flagellar biosynthesis protein FliR [Sulfuriferula multivorans]